VSQPTEAQRVAGAITLTLPFPPRALSPNARPDKWDKARAVRVYRALCTYVAREQLDKPGYRKVREPLTPRVLAVVEYCSALPGPLPDEDNALSMLKTLWDGLVDARVLPGDSPAELHIERFDLRKGPRSEVRVTLRSET